MQPRCQEGGGKPSTGRVNLRGRAHSPEASETRFVREEEFQRRETGLNGQDIRGSTRETVSGPSLDIVPEGGELPYYVHRGFEGMRAIAEDGEKEGGSQAVAQERGEAHPQGGEPFDSHESHLGFGQSFVEVGGCQDRGGEPVSQPAHLVLGGKDRPVHVDRGTGHRISISGGPPVDKLCFRGGEGNTRSAPLAFSTAYCLCSIWMLRR